MPEEDAGEDLDIAETYEYVLVYTKSRARCCLHLSAGCWKAVKGDFKEFELRSRMPLAGAGA